MCVALLQRPLLHRRRHRHRHRCRHHHQTRPPPPPTPPTPPLQPPPPSHPPPPSPLPYTRCAFAVGCSCWLSPMADFDAVSECVGEGRSGHSSSCSSSHATVWSGPVVEPVSRGQRARVAAARRRTVASNVSPSCVLCPTASAGVGHCPTAAESNLRNRCGGSCDAVQRLMITLPGGPC